MLTVYVCCLLELRTELISWKEPDRLVSARQEAKTSELKGDERTLKCKEELQSGDQSLSVCHFHIKYSNLTLSVYQY